MAFFCDKTGVRIVAPGTSKSAGGTVPEHDGSQAHVAAEDAAVKSLNDARKSPEEIAASPEAKAEAVKASIGVLDSLPPKTEPKLELKPTPKPTGRGQ